jgi:hypothetical protein
MRQTLPPILQEWSAVQYKQGAVYSGGQLATANSGLLPDTTDHTPGRQETVIQGIIKTLTWPAPETRCPQNPKSCNSDA